jgi:4-hydroxy-3-methylbut-2-en-1-yl diphosphate reductase
MTVLSEPAVEIQEKKILLLSPRGFCAGVVRAIDVVKIALGLYGAPIYVRKEIVHNRHVVDELRSVGAIFINELDEVPAGARVILHLEAIKFAKQGYTVVLIGHSGHEEVEGTLGEAPDASVLVETVADVDRLELKNPDKVAYLTQTTLSLDETKDIVARLQERFPAIVGPKSQDICYATENRQIAVKAVAPLCDLLLVVGSQNSSNSKRLVEVCQKQGIPSYLIDDFSELRAEWLDGVATIAITAGASAPETLVQQLLDGLRDQHGYNGFEEKEIKDEDVRFNLPGELAAAGARLTQITLPSLPIAQL